MNRRPAKELEVMQAIVTVGRQAGLSRLDDIELFLLVCSCPGFTTFELIEQIYDGETLNRGIYTRFMYALKKLGPGIPKKMKGLGLIDLSKRKTKWYNRGMPPFDIRLTSSGKILRSQFCKLHRIG